MIYWNEDLEKLIKQKDDEIENLKYELRKATLYASSGTKPDQKLIDRWLEAAKPEKKEKEETNVK